MRICPPAEQLHRLILDDLSPAEASGLDAHLQDCVDCQRILDELTVDSRVAYGRLSGSLGRSAMLHIPRGTPCGAREVAARRGRSVVHGVARYPPRTTGPPIDRPRPNRCPWAVCRLRNSERPWSRRDGRSL